MYTLTAASGTQTLSSTATVSVILPDCERLPTGILHVSNLSSHGNDYNIIIDGVDRGRLKANASIDYTLPVGSHSVDFNYSDHDGYGCPTGNPSIIQCQTVSVSCTM